MIKNLISGILLTVISGILTCQAGTIANSDTSVFRLEFILDPRIVSSLTENQRNFRMQHLVADINSVFRRETVRSFSFNPTTDVTLQNPSESAKCQRQTALVGANEILICLSYNAEMAKITGFANADTNPIRGYVSLSGWNYIYDPVSFQFPISANSSTEQRNYINQLYTLTHELEHVFGAGMGEYYSLWTISDPTTISPIYNVNQDMPLDVFWKKRSSWYLDPLLHNSFAAGRVASRRQWLNETTFAPPTKLMINGNWDIWPTWSTSPFLESLKYSKVRIVNGTDKNPVSGASVQVTRAPDDTSNPAIVLVDGVTDLNGELIFDWQCNFRCFSSGEQAIVIKVQKAGFPNQADWFTVHDAFQQIAEGNSAPVVLIALQKADLSLPTVTAQVSGPTQIGDIATVNIQSADNKGIYISEVRGHNNAAYCLNSGKTNTCQFVTTAVGQNIPLTISTVDNYGNVSSIQIFYEVVERVDQLPPLVSLTAPPAAPIYQSIILRATASDSMGIGYVSFYVDGLLVCKDLKAPYSCKWTPQSSGSFAIEAEAVDKSGNRSSAGSIITIAP